MMMAKENHQPCICFSCLTDCLRWNTTLTSQTYIYHIWSGIKFYARFKQYVLIELISSYVILRTLNYSREYILPYWMLRRNTHTNRLYFIQFKPSLTVNIILIYLHVVCEFVVNVLCALKYILLCIMFAIWFQNT